MAEQKSKRRVVVTGMGVVTPIGLNVEDFWQGLHEARQAPERQRAGEAQRRRSRTEE